ncbi:hypothetical protein Taro_053116, partial [Colocasia esculenta]|nr:hypothetical protein [Colocasia esculenta]
MGSGVCLILFLLTCYLSGLKLLLSQFITMLKMGSIGCMIMVSFPSLRLGIKSDLQTTFGLSILGYEIGLLFKSFLYVPGKHSTRNFLQLIICRKKVLHLLTVHTIIQEFPTKGILIKMVRVIFRSAIWWIWRERCLRIFEGKSRDK